jgi:hypothetical protein
LLANHSSIRLAEGWSLGPVAKWRPDMNLNLHAPSMPIFMVSLVLAVLALLGYFVSIPYVTLYGFLLAIIAYVVLALGNVVKI